MNESRAERPNGHRRRTVGSPGVHWALDEDDHASLIDTLRKQLHKDFMSFERRCTQSSLLDSNYSCERPRQTRSAMGSSWWDEETVSTSPLQRRSLVSAAHGMAAGGMMQVAIGVPREECSCSSRLPDEPLVTRNADIRHFQACVHVQGQPLWLPHPITLQQEPGAFVMY